MRGTMSLRELHKLRFSDEGAGQLRYDVQQHQQRPMSAEWGRGSSRDADELRTLMHSLGLSRHLRRLRQESVNYADLACVIQLPTMKVCRVRLSLR